MTKSLIINPPFLEPHRPPISCAILAEILRLEGHDILVKDINIGIFHRMSADLFHNFQVRYTTAPDAEVTAELEKMITLEMEQIDLSSYDWILLSCFSFWNVGAIRLICKMIRPKTKARIVVGGPGIEYEKFGATLHKEGLCDYFIYGEAEIALPELLHGNEDYPGINGRPPEQIIDIESLPLPNYGYFNLPKYDWLLDAPDVFIYGSRGCVRKCTFCDVEAYWPKYRWRSGQSLANEMIANYEKYGIKNFFFADSLVNGNLKEFKVMCELLANYKEGLFRWGSYAIVRPKAAHPASLFDVIKASGGRFWSIGVETGVDRIRFEMDKKFTNEDIDWHLEQSQRIGLQNNFLNIPTWPSETLEEHLEYVNMFKRWQPYAVDGTIYGIRMSNTLGIINTSRLAKEQGNAFEFEKFNMEQLNEGFQWTMSQSWYNEKNPTLTHREKFRRTLALYEAAIEYNWPLSNSLQVINELHSTLLNWQKIQPNILPRKRIISIEKLK